MAVCPLIFKPIYKPKIWGGRNLERILGKRLDTADPVGESWELADLEEDQSVVREGSVAGRTIGELVKEWGRDLIGHAELFEGRFPLLIKFLDASENLSVQVHPDQAMADRMGGNVRVKHEAWYILHAEADGAIYRGFRDGVTREMFVRAIDEGRVASMMRRIPVKPGQCYYLPSGTIHALGAGVVVAEIQTPSDITYRVYDWDRADPKTGKGRELHISEALQCIHFEPDDGGQQSRSHLASVWTAITRLVSCESFMIERVTMVEGIEQPISTGELIVWVVLDGRGEVHYNKGRDVLSFERGDTVVVPAGLGEARLKTLSDCKWLETTIPLSSDLAEYPRPDAARLAEKDQDGFVQLNVRKTDE